MRTGRGGKIAVASSSALLGVCLAGGPLYISSTASEAVQVGLSRTCLADAGLRVVLAPDGDRALLDELAAQLPNTEAPLVTSQSSPIEFHAVGDDSLSPTRLIALFREDQPAHIEAEVAALDALAAGETLVPGWDAEVFGVNASKAIEVTIEPPIEFEPNGSGGSVQVGGGEPLVLPLAVAGTYADIPTRPEPSFWCAQRALFRLKPSGDRPLPVAFVNATTMAQLQPTSTWELRPIADGLTRDEAKDLIAGFTSIAQGYAEANKLPPSALDSTQIESQLPDLVRRAELLAEVVSRTIAPVRIGGIAAAGLLLVASGVLVARERRRELRLRVLRGVGPGRIAARVAVGEIVPVVAGTAAGVAIAMLAVRALGPTPELESGPTVVALVAAAVGAIAAIVTVGAVAAGATSRTVDGRSRRRRHSIPWEWILVPLAVLSYRRLDQFGGVRLLGAEARGGDLLAQAFPILALAAPLALLARPLAAMISRAKRSGRGLRVPVLIGIRRVSFEPAASTVLCLAVAFAVGAYMVSGSLTASAEQLLRDKTNTYLGGDMVVRTRTLDPIPAELQGRATPIALVNANQGGHAIDIIGIDPATFEDAVHWRDDASDKSLHDLVSMIVDRTGDPNRPLPAIVSGSLDGNTVVTKSDAELQLDVVAQPAWFPGVHSGSTLVVVDATAFRARDLAMQSFIWLTNPPADTEQILRANGTNVLNIRESADVFEVTSFLTVRWSYAVLAAFGVLVGFAALVAQLLVLDARREARQATWTLTRRMGLTLRGEAASIAAELGIPLGLGVLLGLGLGWLAVIVAVSPLDTIRHLQPPARVVIDLGNVVTALAVGLAALVVLVVLGLVSVTRTKPMEVMRGSN